MKPLEKAVERVLEEISTKDIYTRRCIRRISSLADKYKTCLRVSFKNNYPYEIERSKDNIFVLNGHQFEAKKVKAIIAAMASDNADTTDPIYKELIKVTQNEAA